jgi:hypothetical protein
VVCYLGCKQNLYQHLGFIPFSGAAWQEAVLLCGSENQTKPNTAHSFTHIKKVNIFMCDEGGFTFKLATNH